MNPASPKTQDLFLSSDGEAADALQPVSLKGRVVLITGGGQGLGAALSRELARHGAHLVLADMDLQRAQAQAATLAGLDIEVLPLALDVADPGQCRLAIARVEQRFGRLDALVNNAATDVTASLAELEVADWLRILHTNLSGPFVLSKYAADCMARRSGGGGHIVNIASTASKRAWPNASAYHASKWGLLGLSHALHAELREQGIRVCAIVAGGMRTPFLLDRFPDLDPERLQDPAHVARAIRHVLQQPRGTSIAELTVLPECETSWP
ncbi:SDR family oxidoreductase [Mitsuaria sp. WAJ17]|uniref:SDR family oxidoreductase n=1 Tax=Mitsuaria sp. WAJ17 TaxID=2761452 RepID=UPI001600C575|nr:SDR family oxidoreductase [Mitsuaria sp. WAJ17]MBB2487641.1 SDR family oxidoreductase [Mitsuaria sp. WAJ17]